MGRVMINNNDEKVYKNIAVKAIELNSDKNKTDEGRKKDLINYVKSLYGKVEEK